VTFHWKSSRFVACAALLALGAGCSGINASHGISPASFFLPGLLKVDPPPQTGPELPRQADPPAPAATEPETAKLAALAR